MVLAWTVSSLLVLFAMVTLLCVRLVLKDIFILITQVKHASSLIIEVLDSWRLTSMII